MTLLLIIIYIIFISLGLPDSLLGTAWPVMYKSFNVDISFASVLSTITLFTTSAVSFISGKYIRKFGTFKLTFVSIILTIVGIIGIALSHSMGIAIIFFIILGAGGGAIDAALNAYISKYFSAKHMNWLHAFWGVGVTVSPLILSIFLKDGRWRSGYLAVACLQTAILVFVFIKRRQWDIIKEDFSLSKKAEQKSRMQIIRRKGVRTSIVAAGCYSAVEFTLGTWAASYLVFNVHLEPAEAAAWVSLYFAGIMVGRILAGFISTKLSDKQLVFGGTLLSMFGIVLLMLPWHTAIIAGLFITGLGYGPIYPAQIHGIPTYFGIEYSADIIGFHMGGAYTMGFIAQVILGFLASRIGFFILPYFLLVFCILLIFSSKLLFVKLRANGKQV